MNNEVIQNKEWKTVRQYAEEKGITVQAVYKAINQNRIRHKKVGYFTFVKDL